MIKGLFEIGEFSKTGLKGENMGGKGGVKEKFSFCRFRLKKVKKVDKLRMGDKKICDAGARHMPNQESGCAAALPGGGPQRRKRKRGKIRPRQISRASCCVKALPTPIMIYE